MEHRQALCNQILIPFGTARWKIRIRHWRIGKGPNFRAFFKRKNKSRGDNLERRFRNRITALAHEERPTFLRYPIQC